MTSAMLYCAWALLALGAIAALPIVVLAFQVALALAAPRRARSLEPLGQARFAVLMPAHDEELGIQEALNSVLAQLSTGDRLLVVADNCSDGTAAVARAAGAEVIERFDATRRGKGYALDFGVRHLEANPPEIVIIVDADCLLADGALDMLARRSKARARPVQALYLMHSRPGGGLKSRIAEFAWIVKNHVRPLGFAQAGLPCQLMGTGMAFPWEQIRAVPLASGHIVEDMQLGLDLAEMGHPPEFLAQARVTSTFASNAEGAEAQRTRWEHGHLRLIASAVPRLLWRALHQRRLVLAAMVLDLCVPPLASLVVCLMLLTALAVALAAFGGATAPLVLSGASWTLLMLAILGAWVGFGRKAVSFRELLGIPSYVLSKVPMYVKLLRKRQSEWVRTKRDDAGA